MAYGKCEKCGRETMGGARLCGGCIGKYEMPKRFPEESEFLEPSVLHSEQDRIGKRQSQHPSSIQLTKEQSSILADGFDMSSHLEEIERLNRRANEAKYKMRNAQSAAKSALQSAVDAKNRAEALEKKTAKWHKKQAIEELQDAVKEMADALNDNASLQTDELEAMAGFSDVQQAIIDYQSKVVNVSKAILGLGAFNLAQSRINIQELEMRVQKASEEKIGEMARNELLATVAQVKQQLDLIERMDRLEKRITAIEGQKRRVKTSKNVGEQLSSISFSVVLSIIAIIIAIISLIL